MPPCNPYNFTLTPERVPNFRPCGCDSPSPPCTFGEIIVNGSNDISIEWEKIPGLDIGMMLFFTVNGHERGPFEVVAPGTIRPIGGAIGQYTIPACAHYRFSSCDTIIFNGITPVRFDWTDLGMEVDDYFFVPGHPDVPIIATMLGSERVLVAQYESNQEISFDTCTPIDVIRPTTCTNSPFAVRMPIYARGARVIFYDWTRFPGMKAGFIAQITWYNPVTSDAWVISPFWLNYSVDGLPIMYLNLNPSEQFPLPMADCAVMDNTSIRWYCTGQSQNVTTSAMIFTNGVTNDAADWITSVGITAGTRVYFYLTNGAVYEAEVVDGSTIRIISANYPAYFAVPMCSEYVIQ